MSARQPFPFKQRRAVAVSVDHIEMVVEYDYTAGYPPTWTEDGADAEVELVTIELGPYLMDADKFSTGFKRDIESVVLKEHA